MTELVSHYNSALVALSLAVAMVSSFVALSVVPRIHDDSASPRRGNLWALVFGVSLGAGIWSMHFVAMLAFSLPVPVRYDITLTLLSLAVGVGFVAFAALPLRRGGEMRGMRLLGVGTLTGLGIVGMHYSGMAAMRMNASVSYDGLIVAASVLIAIGASTAALWLANHLKSTRVFGEIRTKTAAAVVMGLAVSGMHYTGMAAAHFYAQAGMGGPLTGLDTHLIAAVLVAIAVLVQGGVLVAAALDEANGSMRRRLAAESEMLRQSRFNEAMNDLLSIAVRDAPLTRRLQSGLEVLLQQPWLGLSAKGAIFENNGGRLHMRAAVNMGELVAACAQVAAGECLCGKALQNAAPVVRAHLDDDHTVRTEGMHDHGHAIFPLHGRDGVLGVLNLYLQAGHVLAPEERVFLASAAQTIAHMVERERTLEQMNLLKTAVEQMPEGVVIADGDRIVYANPAAAAIHDKSVEELTGMHVAEARGGRMGDKINAAIMECLNQGRSWLGDIEFMLPDGTRRLIERSIAPVMEAGEARYHVCVDTDVTEDRMRQEKMEHTQRLESLGVLAGGIAHDFNNILTAIMGNAALARMKAQHASEVMDYLTRIEESSQRAADLCKQMLAYSGKGRFVVRAVNLSDMVEDITKLLEVSIDRNVVLKFHLAENLPAVEVDAAQLQQVIMNLVINASDAIGEKSGVISLTTGMMRVDAEYLGGAYAADGIEPGRFVFLEVADTGCGMDEEVQKRLFDPFFTTKFTGRGLGMSAVLGIVRGHRGAIKVYSEPGKGSTFKVLLPASSGEIIGQEDGEAWGDWCGVGTVLVVDDEETIRETAAMMLGGMGFDTLTAEDGEQGVEAYREHQDEIVAVLLDMTMPKLDGKACFRELRRINPEVRVVLSSGYNEQDTTSRFAGKGLAGFIQKPYSPEDLQAVFRKVLAGREEDRNTPQKQG